jgi:hypothetical protein
MGNTPVLKTEKYATHHTSAKAVQVSRWFPELLMLPWRTKCHNAAYPDVRSCLANNPLHGSKSDFTSLGR